MFIYYQLEYLQLEITWKNTTYTKQTEPHEQRSDTKLNCVSDGPTSIPGLTSFADPVPLSLPCPIYTVLSNKGIKTPKYLTIKKYTHYSVK